MPTATVLDDELDGTDATPLEGIEGREPVATESPFSTKFDPDPNGAIELLLFLLLALLDVFRSKNEA